MQCNNAPLHVPEKIQVCRFSLFTSVYIKKKIITWYFFSLVHQVMNENVPDEKHVSATTWGDTGRHTIFVATEHNLSKEQNRSRGLLHVTEVKLTPAWNFTPVWNSLRSPQKLHMLVTRFRWSEISLRSDFTSVFLTEVKFHFAIIRHEKHM